METKERKRKPAATKNQPRSSTATNTKRRKTTAENKKRRPADADIVYTQPMPFSRNRFFLRLLTVTAVVLALVFGMAIFFKVKTVTVAGMSKYTPWEIKQASGIQDGDNLLTLSEARISGKIKTALPYVNHVRVGIKLPDTVNIEITEFDVLYAIQAEDSTWWLINADGKVVDTTTGISARNHTQVLGVQLAAPQIGEQASALEATPTQASTEGSTPPETSPITVFGRERLKIVISILQYLEDNGIVGEVSSVDVSDIGALELWYGQRYQVYLGDSTQLSYKIKSMKLAVAQMGEYQSGTLDVSFTNWPNEVGFTPFSEDE